MRKEPFGRVTLLHFFAADQRTLHKEDLPTVLRRKESS